MKKSYRDCLNRIACYADGATGLVEHEYKKVKTKTIVPVGGEYFRGVAFQTNKIVCTILAAASGENIC